MPRVELDALFRQDPSGDIARNAKQILRGEMPTHLARFESAGALARAVEATASLRDVKPTGCFFVKARGEAAAANAVCEEVLGWLAKSGYDLESDVQVLTPRWSALTGPSLPHPHAHLIPDPTPELVCAGPRPDEAR